MMKRHSLFGRAKLYFVRLSMASFRSLLSKFILPAAKITPIPSKVIAMEEHLEKYCPGGYHPVKPGDTFDGGRFSVVRKLGWGQYSTVWLAKDYIDNSHVALKILTHDSGTPSFSFDEVGLLDRIKSTTAKHSGRQHVVLMKHHFKHKGPNGTHICIALEPLGPSIREIERLFRGTGLPQTLVKQITSQILLSLDFLHGSCGIIHSDIKPDNVLLFSENIVEMIRRDIFANPPRTHALARNSKNAPSSLTESQPLIWMPPLDPNRPSDLNLHIKLADFGAANWIDNHTVDVIEPMGLRAPEVILGSGWGPSAEIWGLGCVIWSLLSGSRMIDPKFAAEHNITEEEEVLLQMTMLFGDVPMTLINEGTRGKEFYSNTGELLRVTIELADFNLHQLIEMDPPRDLPKSDVDLFVDFLSRMLKLLPGERETPAELLKHPWLHEVTRIK